MAKQKQVKRNKHIPQRTCIACREVHTKNTLVRIVRRSEGVFPDPGGKAPGRGAYLHARRECWKRGMTNQLPNALRVTLTDTDRVRLIQYFESLPDSGNGKRTIDSVK